MIIDESKQKAIELLIEGKINKSDIAKRVGKSRQWLYESVINDDICRAEMDKRLQEIQTTGLNRIKSNLESNINNIIAMANSAESEKIKLDANIYLVNRVLGNTTTKVEDVTDKDNKEDVTGEDLENEFTKFKIIKKAE